MASANNLELKLQQEKRNLALLNKSLSQSNNLTKSMVTTLNNIERKLQSLAEVITPVIKTNDELQFLLNNVESSISVIDSAFRYYEIRDELLSVITLGPGGNLVDYLTELNRLDDAVKYFKPKADVYERERVTKLYDIGRQKLVEESDKLILRYANPLPPKELLELCESTSSPAVDTYSTQMSDMGAFRIIFDWFKERGLRQGLIDSYATKRGTMIRRSLQLLVEHLRQTIVRRASFCRSSVSPHLTSRRFSIGSDTLREQMKTKINEIGRRLTRSPAIGGRETSSLSPSMTSNNNFLNVDIMSSSMAFSDDRETINYKTLLDGFATLLFRDWDLLCYAFSDEFKVLVFYKLIQLPLAYMHEEAQQLCEAIKQLPYKLETGKFSVYGLFSIIQWFHRSEPTFSKLYQESDLAPRQQFFSTLSTTFEHSAVECLRLVLDEVRNDSSAPSQDGNVHPLTSHVLAFMENLLAYEPAMTTIASNYTEEEKSAGGASSSLPDKRLSHLSTYFTDLVRWLRASILKKIDMYTSRHDRTIRAIFLLNNTNYLLQRLERLSLLVMIEQIEPDLKSKLKDDLQKSVKEYTKCYTPLIVAIQQMLEYDKSNRLPNTKLRERDREQLKQSFLAVNAAIDTIRQQNQDYTISDAQLRDQLRNASKQLVMDMYKAYYTKFVHKDFTRNLEKYTRYDPSMLESIIENFFEH